MLWELTRLTGDTRCLAYAVWLYEEFSSSPVSEIDVQAGQLLRPGAGFAGHGVHTYEHWRALTIAEAATSHLGDAACPVVPGAGHANLPYDRLQAAYLSKLENALTPSGGPNGDEHCHPTGTAGTTGYEFCSIQELLHSYGTLVEATGECSWGDETESLVLNVGMGARDPIEGGVAYLKTDDSSSMLDAEGFGTPDPTRRQTRFMYSPLHREAAVCCVPNAGRLLPTYVRYQWLSGTREGTPQIVALLFGASRLRTTVASVPVTITQVTDYPDALDVAFTIEVDAGEDAGVEAGVDAVLSVRRPAWAQDVVVTGVDRARIAVDGGMVHLSGTWRGATTVTVHLPAVPEVRRTTGGDQVVAWGPLLFARPIPGDREIVRTHRATCCDGWFHDIVVRPVDAPARIRLSMDTGLTAAPAPPGTEAARAAHAWQRQALVAVPLAADGADGANDAWQRVWLVPMGSAVLRQVTFDG